MKKFTILIHSLLLISIKILMDFFGYMENHVIEKYGSLIYDIKLIEIINDLYDMLISNIKFDFSDFIIIFLIIIFIISRHKHRSILRALSFSIVAIFFLFMFNNGLILIFTVSHKIIIGKFAYLSSVFHLELLNIFGFLFGFYCLMIAIYSFEFNYSKIKLHKK